MTHRARLVVAAALMVLVATTAGTPTQAAVADTQGCVTAREFRKADDGMNRARVDRIFDTHGRVVRKKTHRLKVRYKGCGGNGAYAKITYRKRGDGPWRYYSGVGYLN